MADEHNQNTDNENTQTQQNSGSENVSMTQEQLNALINGKFAKGAEKATNELLSSIGVESVEQLKDIVKAKQEADEAQKTELQKMQEQLEALSQEKESLAKAQAEAERKAKLNALAAKNGVTDIDYLDYEYSKASTSENFDENAFILNLKETKPYVFGVVKVNTDTSNNGSNEQKPLAEQIKGMSLKQLQELQNSL